VAGIVVSELNTLTSFIFTAQEFSKLIKKLFYTEITLSLYRKHNCTIKIRVGQKFISRNHLKLFKNQMDYIKQNSTDNFEEMLIQ
jgi:hypothetical protein